MRTQDFKHYILISIIAVDELNNGHTGMQSL